VHPRPPSLTLFSLDEGHHTVPNGYDKNWIWLCATMEAFREEHGRWPTRVHLHPRIFANLQEHLLTPEDFARVTAKVSLIPDGGGITFAEDDTGATCAGFPKKRSEPRAADWFGVRPKPEEDLS